MTKTEPVNKQVERCNIMKLITIEQVANIYNVPESILENIINYRHRMGFPKPVKSRRYDEVEIETWMKTNLKKIKELKILRHKKRERIPSTLADQLTIDFITYKIGVVNINKNVTSKRSTKKTTIVHVATESDMHKVSGFEPLRKGFIYSNDVDCYQALGVLGGVWG